MTWPNYLLGQKLYASGVAKSPRRDAWNFVGATAVYNESTKMWDITTGGGGGGGGTGDFVGPASSVVDRLMLFADTTGKLGKQSTFGIADLIKRNGGTVFTADQSMGGFKLTNLGTPSAGTDAATKAYVDAAAPSGVVLANGTVPLSAAWDVGNQRIDDVRSVSYDGEVDNGNSGAAGTIDWTTGSLQKSTLTGNCTYTFTAPPAFTAIQLRIVQDATGGRTVTWPGTVVWDKGYAPKMAGGPDTEIIISGYYDGTNYRFANPDRGVRQVTETGTTRTLIATDANASIACTHASGCTVTVPTHASVPFEEGVVILFEQVGAGQVTLVGAGGVTFRNSETLKTLKQYSRMGIEKKSANVWSVYGERELA